jgi:hypothetical protein
MAQNGAKWWKRKALYNIDFLLQPLGSISYALGISIDPARTIIGKEGWLYLGDAYESSITTKRMGVQIKDEETIEKIANSVESWNNWFKHKGVEEFRIILGPDKDSIYPEYLPDWSKHATQTVTDAMINRTTADIYINPAAALRQAKSKHPHPFYYKTDTHWNNLGAWLAFNEFSQNLARARPELGWPQARGTSNLMERPGGDLANFLRIQNSLKDHETVLDFHLSYPTPVEHYDLKSGEKIYSGQASPIAAPLTPLLVRSAEALNTKRVLWLRDSFGTAMAPFMAATFSEIIQVHYLKIKPSELVGLIERYHPDYVFITSVERDSRGAFFQTLPPST